MMAVEQGCWWGIEGSGERGIKRRNWRREKGTEGNSKGHDCQTIERTRKPDSLERV